MVYCYACNIVDFCGDDNFKSYMIEIFIWFTVK